MSFSENLQYLRRTNKITQEQLAEELNVSRQSVSKWETGEAYPETEKIIMLCDKFDVTMDALLRGDVTQNAEKDNNEAIGEIISNSEIQNEMNSETEAKLKRNTATKIEFIKHIDKFSRRIAIGVTLIIISAALAIIFIGGSRGGRGPSEPLRIVIGIAAIICTCVAVFLFISSGISRENFQRRSPEMDEVLSEEEKNVFGKKFAVKMASFISALIIAPIALAVTVNVAKIEGYDGLIAAAVFMFVISFIIGGIVYLGIQHQKFDIKEYNRESRLRRRHDSPNNIYDAVCGAIMLTATGVFLLIGFVWNLWHPGWVVFPLGGIICAIISIFQKANKPPDHS